MAINNDAQYPGRTTPGNANYPQGSSKNETAPGANDGTPYELARANDLFGLLQGLLFQSTIVASGAADTAVLSQYLGGIIELASKGRTFVDSGAADVYVLTAPTSVQAATKYFNGMEAYFLPANSNTGATTVNLATLGAKAVVRSDGSALQAGDVLAGQFVLLRFDFANDRFQLVAFPLASVAEMQAAVSTVAAVTPGRQAQHPAHAKAKAVFDGTGAIGVKVPLDSYNIATINKTGTGVYVITFTTPLADANYAVQCDAVAAKCVLAAGPTANTLTLNTLTTGGTTAVDSARISVICV